MDIDDLRKLIDGDEFGLLKIKPVTSTSLEHDRLISKFNEINNFYLTHNRVPENNKKDPIEFSLFKSLKAFKSDNRKAEFVMDYDEFGLLGVTNSYNSIEDIFNDDVFKLMEDRSEDIFTIKHIPKVVANSPDYVAKRKPCKDFIFFEDLFKECQTDIKSEKRKLRVFTKEQQIDKGQFFVLKGVLLYVAEAEEKKKMENGLFNRRLRCIFENGTESDLLQRSLAAELYKDGRRVTEKSDELLFDSISEEDIKTGYIYIVKSLSSNPQIASINDLYKIGYSKTHPEKRVLNAEIDPTFLKAPVKLISSYECFNLNPQKLEFFLHKFFAFTCLDIDIYDGANNRISPREWFVVPLSVIEEAVELMRSGEITEYKYDPVLKRIVGR